MPRLSPLLAVVLFGAIAIPAAGQDGVSGRDLYLEHCASCHGADARGMGPTAQYFEIAPTDLTLLAARHGGQFPFPYVYQVIDGRAMVTAHGDRAMPVWGDLFRRDLGFDISPALAEDIVYGRILKLMTYLESLQRPAEGEPE